MADIKEKEKILRALPASGLTDPATGEIFLSSCAKQQDDT